MARVTLNVRPLTCLFVVLALAGCASDEATPRGEADPGAGREVPALTQPRPKRLPGEVGGGPTDTD
jgi:hypothetical protein